MLYTYIQKTAIWNNILKLCNHMVKCRMANLNVFIWHLVKTVQAWCADHTNLCYGYRIGELYFICSIDYQVWKGIWLFSTLYYTGWFFFLPYYFLSLKKFCFCVHNHSSSTYFYWGNLFFKTLYIPILLTK